MIRAVLGVIAGFFVWIVLWVGIEKVLIAILPEWYGAPQLAFQHAVENRVDQFSAETRLLLSHVVIASVVALVSGLLASLVAGENKRTPVILGFLLVALGLLKVVMSWAYVPVWYHIIFTAVLLPMAIIGAKMKRTA